LFKGKKPEIIHFKSPAGACISAALTCVLPDYKDHNTLYFCNIYGIFKTKNGARTFRLVFKVRPE
jgi:hypothetical protein